MITTFDFGDGNGPVRAHRHANGGGWVADTAQVAESAYVGKLARVSGEAQVYDEAQVYGKARVFGEAQVSGKALVSGKARVFGEARVCDTPLCLTGFEFIVTVCDNTVQVGCKQLTRDQLRADIFPEEQCPRLRQSAPGIIELVRAHWDYCAKIAQTEEAS